jgi:uncharacterized lipoprotein YajG
MLQWHAIQPHKGTLTNKIIQPVEELLMQPHTVSIFHHDDALQHIASYTRQNNVKVLQLLAKSPDLSPIEHKFIGSFRLTAKRTSLRQ